MDVKLHKFEFYLFIERLSVARSKGNKLHIAWKEVNFCQFRSVYTILTKYFPPYPKTKSALMENEKQERFHFLVISIF